MAECEGIDGGLYNVPPTDGGIDGGMYNSAPLSGIDGGSPMSPCGVYQGTAAAGYIGALGDGGDGHTAIFTDSKGTPIIELSCADVTSIQWSRELSEVSRCILQGGSFTAPQVLNDLRPWVHRITVYRGGDFVWEGVIQVVDGDGESWQVIARDNGCYLWRTRTPLTKTWNDADPVGIAAENFAAVYGWHRLPAAVPATYASAVAYDYSTVKDRRRVDQVVSDLVKLGVDWTIMRGRAVLMPTVRSEALVSPVGYSDCDFAERVSVRRDGTRFFTDIMVKGQNFTATATRELADLRLQDIVALDDLFGQNNVRLAAEQLVARRAAIRLQVQVPNGATLVPDSPIQINQLMPGVIFPVYTSLGGGVYAERKLEKVEVTQENGGEQVQITLGQVPLPPSADVDWTDL